MSSILHGFLVGCTAYVLALLVGMGLGTLMTLAEWAR